MYTVNYLQWYIYILYRYTIVPRFSYPGYYYYCPRRRCNHYFYYYYCRTVVVDLYYIISSSYTRVPISSSAKSPPLISLYDFPANENKATAIFTSAIYLLVELVARVRSARFREYII